MAQLVNYEIEMERIAEWLFNNRRRQINDRGSFNDFFKQDINDGRPVSGIVSRLREGAFQEYSKLDRSVLERKVSKGRPQRKTRVFVDDPQRPVSAFVKKKIVKAKEFEIKRRGKKVKVFRDSKGRFAKRL